MTKYDDCEVVEKDGIKIVSFLDDKKSIDTLSKIIFMEFSVEKGDSVSEGTPLITMEAMKGTLELKSKVSGKVLEINLDVAENPEQLKKNPKTWLIKIK